MTYYIFFLYNKSTYFGAEDEVRTRDILLGRQVLYQLSYFRLAESEGFEPSVRLHVQHLSRVPLSTTQPTLLKYTLPVYQICCISYTVCRVYTNLAPQDGLEPPTHGLTDRCYYQLSYWGIKLISYL